MHVWHSDIGYANSHLWIYCPIDLNSCSTNYPMTIVHHLFALCLCPFWLRWRHSSAKMLACLHLSCLLQCLHALSIISSTCSRYCEMYLISNYKEKWVVWVHSSRPGHFGPFQRIVGKNNRPVQRKNHLNQTKQRGSVTRIFTFWES